MMLFALLYARSLRKTSAPVSYTHLDDVAFCEALAREVGVGAVPGSSFFREDVRSLIRLHFAKRDETLLEALNRLEGIGKLKK